MSAASAFTRASVVETFRDALRDEFGANKSSAKIVADIADTNPRTAENWLAGENAPHLYNFLRLIREVPALRKRFFDLIGQETNLDPMFERDLVALVQTYQRLKGAE